MYIWKQQYVRWFDMNYSIEKTYYAPFWYLFHSTTSKKIIIHAQQLNYGKFLPKTTILEQQNNKQELQILEAQRISNIQPKLNRINFETSVNVLKRL